MARFDTHPHITSKDILSFKKECLDSIIIVVPSNLLKHAWSSEVSVEQKEETSQLISFVKVAMENLKNC